MGVFKRFTNTVRAKVNAALNSVENPVESLDLQIRDVKEQYDKAKSLTAEVVGNAKRLKIDLEKANKERTDLEAKLKIVFESGQDALAKEIIQRKIKLDSKISSLLQRTADAEERSEKALKDLRAFEQKYLDLKDYRADAVSRYNTAKVTTNLSKIQDTNTDIDMTDIEDMIQKEEDYAYGLSAVNEVNAELTFNGAVDLAAVEAEYAKYKEQFGKKS